MSWLTWFHSTALNAIPSGQGLTAVPSHHQDCKERTEIFFLLVTGSYSDIPREQLHFLHARNIPRAVKLNTAAAMSMATWTSVGSPSAAPRKEKKIPFRREKSPYYTFYGFPPSGSGTTCRQHGGKKKKNPPRQFFQQIHQRVHLGMKSQRNLQLDQPGVTFRKVKAQPHRHVPCGALPAGTIRPEALRNP